MKNHITAFGCALSFLARLRCGVPGGNHEHVVFLETMATTPAKPWTGTGCDNAWTVTFNGANPFEQSTNANYGGGNPCGLQFKQGTTNLGRQHDHDHVGHHAPPATSATLEFYPGPTA